MLNLKTWLSSERGRATALAAHLGVSLSRISQMADDGVPPKYMLAVRDFTGGEVTLESLVQERSASLDPAKATDPPKPAAPPAQAPDLSTTELDEAGLVDRREALRRTDDVTKEAELKAIKAGKEAGHG